MGLWLLTSCCWCPFPPHMLKHTNVKYHATVTTRQYMLMKIRFIYKSKLNINKSIFIKQGHGMQCLRQNTRTLTDYFHRIKLFFTALCSKGNYKSHIEGYRDTTQQTIFLLLARPKISVTTTRKKVWSPPKANVLSSFFIHKPLHLIEFITSVLSLIPPPPHLSINPCILYTFF